MENRNSVSDQENMNVSAPLMNTQQSSDEDNLEEALRTLPKLGLKLSVTSSLLDSVNQTLSPAAVTVSTDQSKPKKLKAESFKISLLRVGSWERVSRNEGDLVAKCYFTRRLLAWEFLEDGLKMKIDVQWHEILSLKAVLIQGQSGVLEIELLNPPTFYEEIDPKPKRHTRWSPVSDFTEGQAPTFRRHYLEFPPGVLDGPFEKILRNDHRLFQMSQPGNFPVLVSPYFPKPIVVDFTVGFGAQFNINPGLLQQPPLSLANVPTFVPAPLNLPFSGSNQMPLLEGQGGIMNVGGSSNANQMRGATMPSGAASSFQQASSSMAFGNNYLPPWPQNQLGGLVPVQQQPSMMFQNMMNNNSQTGFPNSITDGNLFMQGSLGNNNMTNDVISPGMVDDSVSMNNGFSNNGANGGQMYPAMNWPVPNGNPFSPSASNNGAGGGQMHPAMNWPAPNGNSFSPSASNNGAGGGQMYPAQNWPAPNDNPFSPSTSNNGASGGQMHPALNWPAPNDNPFSSSAYSNDFNPEIGDWTNEFNPLQWQ